jgi:uncharacterized metal-binding protein YceD (DUF177 family)
MPTQKHILLQFAGLSFGEYNFEYLIEDKFFEAFEKSEIKKGKIKVKLNLLKQSQMLVLEFEIGGTVRMECDICLEEFDLPLTGNYRLIVKQGGNDTGDDDDIITIGTTEHQIDLAQYIYEYCTLSLPIRRIHPLDKKGEPTCNKEVLKKLKKYLTKEEKAKSTDPRWNDLKNIKLN